MGFRLSKCDLASILVLAMAPSTYGGFDRARRPATGGQRAVGRRRALGSKGGTPAGLLRRPN